MRCTGLLLRALHGNSGAVHGWRPDVVRQGVKAFLGAAQEGAPPRCVRPRWHLRRAVRSPTLRHCLLPCIRVAVVGQELGRFQPVDHQFLSGCSWRGRRRVASSALAQVTAGGLPSVVSSPVKSRMSSTITKAMPEVVAVGAQIGGGAVGHAGEWRHPPVAAQKGSPSWQNALVVVFLELPKLWRIASTGATLRRR